ncbi:MAG: ATP-binding protein [Bacteroidales bacterium]|nr:ATP-binding protein [Bacteroidales bacterium]MCF8343396.1 ATP-binding protein [Bacteroidales bacterium]MCF8351765.1 ATP-binding protein [Bacteroidales bacterium]MCF8377567.1 ATP-binding protein [Bacteroidales bacterium]MCF8401702.1 ATP-binding protein [Bacteroidales bacterium]
MSRYIKQLITQGEHQKLDFKFEISDSRKIARSLVAFANTDGGKLLVGVKDNGAIAGVRSDEEKHMVETAASIYCKPEINFNTTEWEVEGKTVLEVDIEQDRYKPYYAQTPDDKWMVYIRVKDQNLLANNILLRVWDKKRKQKGVKIKYTEPEKFLLNYLKNKPDITLNKYYKLANISRRKAENILVNFISLNIIDMEFTEKTVYYKLSKEDQDA